VSVRVRVAKTHQLSFFNRFVCVRAKETANEREKERAYSKTICDYNYIETKTYSSHWALPPNAFVLLTYGTMIGN